jgi:hypothetical protein
LLRVNFLHRAEQMLDVMADLVRDDVGLREIAGCAETRPQVAIEREVYVNLLVARTVERPRACARHAAARARLFGEERERRLPVTPARLLKELLPHVLRLGQHDPGELLEFVFRRIARSRALRARRWTLASTLIEQLARVCAKQQREHDQDNRAESAADRHAAARHAPAIFHIRTFPPASPTHNFYAHLPDLGFANYESILTRKRLRVVTFLRRDHKPR